MVKQILWFLVLYLMLLRIRPHHFLCLTFFRGKGYSHEFVENIQRIIEEMMQYDTVIEVVEGCDDVCSMCPHMVDGRCVKHENSEMKVREMDSKLLAELKLSYGNKINVKALHPLKKRLTITKIQSICKKCEWLSLCSKIAKATFRSNFS